MSEAVDAVVRAWVDPGVRPDVHAHAQAALRREWPVLARAIEALVQEEDAR
jgi:hypothetical protein